MGRPKKIDIQKAEVEINEEAIQAAYESTTLVAHQSQEALSKIGYNQPYERERVIGEAKIYMGQSAAAMLEAGRRLLAIKECEPHGEFLEIVKNRLNLPIRTAQIMMQATTKFLMNPALASNTQSIAHLGVTKLFDLMVEDDENLLELTEGGTLAGVTLDDIDRMSTRELREHLRESRALRAADQKLMDDKNRKLDQLQTKVEKKEKYIQESPKDTAFKDAKAEIVGHFNRFGDFIAYTLKPGIEVLLEHGGADALEVIARHINGLELTLRGLRNEYGVPDDVDASWVDDWKKEQEQSASKE